MGFFFFVCDYWSINFEVEMVFVIKVENIGGKDFFGDELVWN